MYICRPASADVGRCTPASLHGCRVQPSSLAQAVEQVAFADRILLNKCDLVDAEQLATIKSRLKVGDGLGR